MRPTEVMRLAWMELTVSCIPFTSSKIFMRVINNIAAEISRFSTLLVYSARKTSMAIPSRGQTDPGPVLQAASQHTTN